jgi:2-keto-3-deoxy-galactonokinase
MSSWQIAQVSSSLSNVVVATLICSRDGLTTTGSPHADCPAFLGALVTGIVIGNEKVAVVGGGSVRIYVLTSPSIVAVFL